MEQTALGGDADAPAERHRVGTESGSTRCVRSSRSLGLDKCCTSSPRTATNEGFDDEEVTELANCLPFQINLLADGVELETNSVLLFTVAMVKVLVRVTFDGKLFHPAEELFRKVLPTYCTVIAWNRTDLFKHLSARKYFNIVQLRTPLFCVKWVQNVLFKSTKLNLIQNSEQQCCKSDPLVFCTVIYSIIYI